MCTKKQISSLGKLHSVYEEIPEEFLDKTGADSYFYHNILDISQYHHRIVRLAKDPTKKFCIQVISFLRLKVTAAIYSQGKSQHFQKRNLISTRQFG